jgi:hypothetical protein
MTTFFNAIKGLRHGEERRGHGASRTTHGADGTQFLPSLCAFPPYYAAKSAK